MGVSSSPDRQVRLRSLPPDPTSARAAREFVRAACRDWGMNEEVCEDAELVATELVSNVVDHAGTSCLVIVSRNDTKLRIDVEDLYPCSIPEPRTANLTALHGRGLQGVAAVSAAWGVRELRGGKSVWAVLENR